MKIKQAFLVFGGIAFGIVLSLFVQTTNAESVISQHNGEPVQEVVEAEPAPVVPENPAPVTENQPVEQQTPSSVTPEPQPAPCSL